MRARKPSDPASGRSSSRLGLTVLVATVAAFLLVGVAQAAAATVKVNVAGTGSGEVVSLPYESGTPEIECSGPPKAGSCTATAEEFISLGAVPDGGSTFTGWTITKGEAVAYCDSSAEEIEAAELFATENGGKFTGMTGECFIFEVGGEIEVTATFAGGAPNNLKLNVEEGEGTVVSNPAGLECTKAMGGSCEASVTEGDVTLTASPAPGYAFKSWKGCDSTTVKPGFTGVNGRQCKIVAGATLKTIGVKFYKVWNLKMSKSNPNGIASTSPGGVNCGYGCLSSAADYKPGSVILKAKPAKNFHFVKFQNGTGSASSCNGETTETCTFTIGADSTIEEVYAENAKKTLTLTKKGGGQGFIKTKPTNINCGYTCVSAAAEFFASETAVPVTVILNKGTTSVTWSGATGGTTCTGNALSCTVDMSTNQTLTAEFK